MANIKRNRQISNIILTVIILAGIYWVSSHFIHLGNVEYTDNAQIKQHITPINTRVPGFIKKIYFEEYQKVRKGDTLLVIEDSEYLLRLAQAEANYRNALVGKDAMHTTISTTESNILVTDAGIREAGVRLKNAEADYKRYSEMIKKNAVTAQQFDRVKTEYEAAKARYEQMTRQKQSTSLVKHEQTQRLEQNDAAIKVAEAEFNLARLSSRSAPLRELSPLRTVRASFPAYGSSNMTATDFVVGRAISFSTFIFIIYFAFYVYNWYVQEFLPFVR